MRAQTRWAKKKVAEGLCMTCGKEPIYKTNRCYTHYMHGLALAKKWNRDHSEYRKEYMKRWHSENKDKVREYNKIYRERIRGNDDEHKLNKRKKDCVEVS